MSAPSGRGQPASGTFLPSRPPTTRSQPCPGGVSTPVCRTRRSSSFARCGAHRGPRLRLDLDLGPLLRRRPGQHPTATRPWPRTPPWPATPSGSGAVRWSTAPATATRRSWPTPSATIDHLSGGRAELGLGAGWAVSPSTRPTASTSPGPATRLDILEESVACIRSLLRDEVTDFPGEHFTLTDAHCDPKPVQAELPIWVGGGGEKRTLRIAARYADGWNVPFVSPEVFAHKRLVLHDHCADGRTGTRSQITVRRQRRRRARRGRPGPPVRRHRRDGAPRRADGLTGADDRPRSAATPRSASTRSTSPCGPPGTCRCWTTSPRSSRVGHGMSR